MKGARILAFVVLAASSACAVLVGIDDHVLAVPVEAGPVPTVVITQPSGKHPTAIAVDSDYVYWLDEATAEGQGSFWFTTRVDAGARALAYQLSNPVGLRLLPSNAGALFTNDTFDGGTGTLYRAKAPNMSTQWEYDGGYGALAVRQSASVVYAFTEAVGQGEVSIRRTEISTMVPKPMNTCLLYTQKGATRFPAILVDDANVYFADDATESIKRIPVKTGINPCDPQPPSAEVFAPNQRAVAIIFGFNNTMIWITKHTLVTQNKLTGTSAVTLDDKLEGASAIAVHGGSIFVADEDAGKIWQYASGNAAKTLFIDVGRSKGLRAISAGPPSGDDDALYWTQRTTGEIMKLSFP